MNDCNEQEVFDPKVIETRSDGTLVEIVDWREGKPLSRKLNPIWWAKNDWDRKVPDWYLPGESEPWRKWMWWWRNPFENFKRWVLGVGDQNYKIVLTKPGTYESGQLRGWEIGYLEFDNGNRLPWYCYGSETAKFYWGWQPTGTGAIKFNGRAWALAPSALVLAPLMVVLRALNIFSRT